MEENRDPVCDSCGLLSPVKFDGSTGRTGALLQEIGWIYKNAVLFTNKNTPLCFCSKECCKSYYQNVLKVSAEQSDKINGFVRDSFEAAKKDIPKMAETIGRFKDALLKIKNNSNK